MTESSGILDILLHPRLPPLVRPLPPMENISLFRVEESEVEQELRTMLGLATADDSESGVSAQLAPQAPSDGPEDPAERTELTSSSRFVPDPAPSILNRSNPPAQSSNDMQVDQTKAPPVTTPPPDQTPINEGPLVSNPTSSAIKSSERLPPVSEPPRPSSWNPIGFISDEDEEDEEIPSINMDSDSD